MCTSVFPPDVYVLYTASDLQITGLLFNSVKTIKYGTVGGTDEGVYTYNYLGRDNLFVRVPPNNFSSPATGKAYWQECDIQLPDLDLGPGVDVNDLLTNGYITTFYGDCFINQPDNPGVTAPRPMVFEGSQVLTAFDPDGDYPPDTPLLYIRSGETYTLGSPGRSIQFADNHNSLAGQLWSSGVNEMYNDYEPRYGNINASPPSVAGAALSVAQCGGPGDDTAIWQMIDPDLTIRMTHGYAIAQPVDGIASTCTRSVVRLGTSSFGLHGVDEVFYPFITPDSYAFACMILSASPLTDEQKFTIADGFYNGGNLLCLPIVLDPPVPVACQPCCQTRVNLSWPAIENATAYEIARDDVVIATTTAITYTDRAVTIGSTYTYSVTAAAGSIASAPGLVTIKVRGFTEDAPTACTFSEDAATSCTFTEVCDCGC